jgi:hypothetical protein
MALDGASSGDASAPPPPPSPSPPPSTRDRRVRKPRATTSWRTRRLSRRSGWANGSRDLRLKCLRHREAQREARRRRALLLSGVLRCPSGQPKHGEPMVDTVSSQAQVRSWSTAHEDRGLRGEARAENTVRVGYSDTHAFSVRAFGDCSPGSKHSIMV